MRRDDVFERLRDADPVRPDDAALLALAERVVIVRRRHPRTRRLAVAALAVVVTVVGSFVAWSLGSTTPATAGEVLRRTSQVAGSLEPPADEPYVYVHTDGLDLKTGPSEQGPWSASQRVEEETWVAPDGSGRTATTFGTVIFFGQRDKDRWRAGGEQAFPSGSADHRLPPGAQPFDDVATLPLEPTDLYGQLRKDVAGQDEPTDVAVFERVGQLLARGDASPALRASLYRVVAGLDGVQLVGDFVDPLGRHGTAVSLRFDSQGAALRSVLVFDEATSSILAEETQLLEAADWIDARPGDVIDSVAYVQYGVVPSDDARPASSADLASG